MVKRSVKRRKISTKKDTHLTYEELVTSFRIGFLELLDLSSREWESVFQDTDVDVDFESLSSEEISELLLENKDLVQFRFENSAIDEYEKDEKKMSKKVTQFLENYFSGDSPPVRFIPIVRNFFSEDWAIFVDYRLRERRIEDIEATKQVTPITHMKIFNVEIPIDVVCIIMRYLPHNHNLVCTLGLASEKWFRIVLSTWHHVVLSYRYLEIPALVLQNVKNIRFSSTRPKRKNPFLFPTGGAEIYRERKLDLVDCLERINLNNLRVIDLSSLGKDTLETETEKPIVLSLPNLNELRLPRITYDIVEVTEKSVRTEASFCMDSLQFQNLNRLKCLWVDVSHLHRFSNLETLEELGICFELAERNEKVLENLMNYVFKSVEDFHIIFSGGQNMWLTNRHVDKKKVQTMLTNFIVKSFPSCRILELDCESDHFDLCLDLTPLKKLERLIISKLRGRIDRLYFTEKLQRIEYTRMRSPFEDHGLNDEQIKKLINILRNCGRVLPEVIIGCVHSVSFVRRVPTDLKYLSSYVDNMVIPNIPILSYSTFPQCRNSMETVQLIRTVTFKNVNDKKEIHIYLDSVHYLGKPNYGCDCREIIEIFLMKLKEKHVELEKLYDIFVYATGKLQKDENGELFGLKLVDVVFEDSDRDLEKFNILYKYI